MTKRNAQKALTRRCSEPLADLEKRESVRSGPASVKHKFYICDFFLGSWFPDSFFAEKQNAGCQSGGSTSGINSCPDGHVSAAACTIFSRCRSSYRYRQVRGPDTICIDSSARNLAIIIYVFGAFEACRITAFEIVEVCGCVAVIPNNCTTISLVRVARYADYLAGFVDTVSLAVDMFWRTALQRFEMPNAVLPGPHERMYYVAFNKRWVAIKPDNITALIDCCRRVPPLSSEVAEVSHSTVFPKHGMPGCVSSNGLIADA